MKISIIIPIFNAQQYLGRCVDSVLGQSYRNLEVILIDDGSTDSSGQICEDYVRKDSRVRTIHVNNQGQGAARNFGLQMSKGDYVGFVDADDVLVNTAIEKLAYIAETGQYDIVSGNYMRVNGKVKVSSNYSESGEILRKGSLKAEKRYNSYKTTSGFGYVWGKLYRVSFLKKHNLSFNTERKAFMEDSLFNLKAFAFNPRYYILNEPVYYYYCYENSVSNKKEDITTEALEMINNYERFLILEDKYDENLDLYVPLVSRVICWAVFKKIQAGKLTFSAIRETITCFYKNKAVELAFSHPKAFRELAKLPGLLERIFFSICILCFRLKLYNLFSFLFMCSFPFSKLYVNKKVKS